MKLEELQNLGAFVDSAPVQKTVKICGQEIVVGVERLAFAEALKLRGEKELHDFYPVLISRCVHFEGGEKMSEAQARKLDSDAAKVLLEAIGEVNGTDPKAGN